MVKGSGSRRSDSAQVPSREDGAIAKNPSQGSQVRRNCPWTEAEHRLFLLGLDEYGRGAWRAIAAEYVGTRTATQVASHAQKYFLREGLPASRREKKRPSIHDIRSASEAPCMTTEERMQLRNSLQLMNRESMESIDTSAMEGVRGHRHSASAALGRSTRLFAADTGSSGEASTAAGDKNACSSKRKSSEEDLVARSELMWQTVPDQSVQAADTSMHGTSRRRTMDATQRADWQSSALFNPTATAATLPHEFSSSSPFQEQEASALGMIQPADTFEVARAAAAAGGTMLPIGLHRLNGSFGMGMPAHGPPPAHIQNPSLSAAALGQFPPVGMAGDFPAAFPVRHSLSDTRSSLYEDITLDAPPPMADRLGWSGPFPMGQVGMYGQAVAPSGGASGGYGCPECDLLHCACTRRHSDVRPMSVSTQQGPSQVQAQLPSSFLPSSLTMPGTADTIQQSSATFMVNPQSEAMSQQDLFAPAAQPTEPMLAFGSAPAGMSYVPSLEDFRLLPPTSDRPEEPLMSTPDQEDAGLLGMENMNEDYMEI